ncbi:SCO family protein [Paenibacillus sp. GD4]|uniref:SCO family protein n=1 Tax=Paenibacillus TaxID=44249 RepID=UPI002542E5E7|nr:MULTISPECIES: SCO family protein [Paenibacillus]MDQ1912077.1 SCO family protein [Paenibacillus sp. GD4]
MKNKGFQAIVIILLLGLIGSLGYMLIKGPEEKIGVIKKAPDFELTNVDGKKMSLADTAGKARLVYFYFSTCPDVCSPTTYTISKIQDKLVEKGVFGTKTAFLSISFDPKKDTQAQLQQFANRFHYDPKGWFFLRGEDETAMMELAQKYGIMVVKDAGADTFSHTNYILLVDGKGDIRTYYNGSDVDLDLDKVVNDLIKISKE